MTTLAAPFPTLPKLDKALELHDLHKTCDLYEKYAIDYIQVANVLQVQ